MSWQDIVDVADAALYTAKRTGRDRWAGLAAGPRLNQVDLAMRLKRYGARLIVDSEITFMAAPRTSGDLASAF